jgi:hypothetical protein
MVGFGAAGVVRIGSFGHDLKTRILESSYVGVEKSGKCGSVVVFISWYCGCCYV